jgi:hypothetical protein
VDQLGAFAENLMSIPRTLAQDLVSYLPLILSALALIALGWVVARFLRSLSFRLINRIDWLFRSGRTTDKAAAENIQYAAARAFSALIFWAVMLTFAAAAIQTIGSPLVDEQTVSLLAYLPELIGGSAIMVLGFVGGSLARNVLDAKTTTAGIAQGTMIGRLSQAAIVIAGIVIGVNHIGIDVSFLVGLISVLVGTTTAGVALALVLGTRGHLSNLVGMRYVQKHYAIGDWIRIGEHHGQVMKLSDGYLFLDTEQGDVAIPGRLFTVEPSTKTDDEATHVSQ